MMSRQEIKTMEQAKPSPDDDEMDGYAKQSFIFGYQAGATVDKQFKPKQYDFPENIPDHGVRVLAYSGSQGWQVMHRGYEVTNQEPYWILSATCERAYLNITKWQHLPEKPA